MRYLCFSLLVPQHMRASYSFHFDHTKCVCSRCLCVFAFKCISFAIRIHFTHRPQIHIKIIKITINYLDNLPMTPNKHGANLWCCVSIERRKKVHFRETMILTVVVVGVVFPFDNNCACFHYAHNLICSTI